MCCQTDMNSGEGQNMSSRLSEGGCRAVASRPVGDPRRVAFTCVLKPWSDVSDIELDGLQEITAR